ncbi:BglG family transcription antiterminator [Liquorilactobacillus sicerae]|uniref:BglG family transcription antiterminator n=1 Tax=Liquorilactobacillus sicerae TaxID=1416943 RepID=UPI00247FD261|nr:PRD domain-containing protein [Liquorilactobacillus sicerae]
MNKNINKMLDVLLQQKGFITNKQLSDLVGVTERSIRNYVAKVNGTFKDDKLIVSTEKGYKINKGKYDSSSIGSNDPNTDDQILFRIALLLTNSDEYTQIDVIADKLSYSGESIRNKIQKLFMRIKKLDIELNFESKIFTGVRLVGNEESKRLLLEELMPIKIFSKENLSYQIYSFFDEMVNMDDISKIIRNVESTLTKNNCTMDYWTYVKLIIHMIIMNYRMDNNNFVKRLSVYEKTVDGFSEYKLAYDLINNLGNDCTKEELLSLTYYLLALPLDITNPEIILNDEKMISLIEDTLFRAEKYFNIPVYSNEKYRNQIVNHIARLLNPIKEKIPIFNPYFTELKHEYIFAYSISSFIYDDLEKHLDLTIPEPEIAYLSIHIQLVLNDEKKDTLKALLIVNNKQIETKLIKNKVEMFFQNIQVKQIDHEFNKSDFDEFDLVLTTINENTNENCGKNDKLIHISRNFSSADIQNVQQFISTIGTSNLINDVDYYQINETSNLAAIEKLLDLSGYSNLFINFKERESMSSTDVGNFTALPHPFLTKFSYDPKVIVGINKTDILWENQKVRLIIVYIPSKELEVNKGFFRDVYVHTNNLETVQKLLKTKNKEKFIKTWNEERGY